MLILPLFHWFYFTEWLCLFVSVYIFALFVLSITKRDTALGMTLEELIQAANAACSQNFT